MAQERPSSGSLASRVSQGVSWAITGLRPPQRATRRNEPPYHGLPVFSKFSTPPVKDSAWGSADFMLGAAMVIIQENTHKIVVVHDRVTQHWFFPRGRKDVGESLEQTALREAYEESGYRAQFMPHWGRTHAPPPPSHGPEELAGPHCEPIFITTLFWPPRRRLRDGVFHIDTGGEYLISWFLGQIDENSIKEIGTGMPDEQSYEAHLLTYDQALQVARGAERRVLVYAWEIYQERLGILEEIKCLETPALSPQSDGLATQPEVDSSWAAVV